VLLSYGKFVQAAVDFLIIALAIFLVVKGINNLKRKEEAKPAAPPPLPEPSAEQKLLAEIRDLLKNR
jgi:large conductance mechanosensitive channel